MLKASGVIRAEENKEGTVPSLRATAVRKELVPGPHAVQCRWCLVPTLSSVSCQVLLISLIFSNIIAKLISFCTDLYLFIYLFLISHINRNHLVIKD